MEWDKGSVMTVFSIIVLGIALVGVTFSYFINKTGHGHKTLTVDNVASSLAYNMDSPMYIELK